MGAAGSVLDGFFVEGISLEMCVRIVMPLYYTEDPVTPADLIRARKSWNLILDDESPAWKRSKSDPSFSEISCLSQFYTVFYNRLFEIHPASKPLFKGNIQIQGKALAKIISFLLKEHKDPVLLNSVLVDMANRHIHNYGVKAHEYGLMGEALLYGVAHCVGKEEFDDETANAWVRIYSMVISITVPMHVRHELQVQIDKMSGRTTASTIEPSADIIDLSVGGEIRRKSISC
jgi:hemoglobin-like flavoprotein